MARLDWDELQAAWRQPPPGQLPELKSVLRRRTHVIWWLTAADAVATAVALILAGRWFITEPGLRSASVVVLLLVLVSVCWWLVLRLRRGTWRLDSDSPREVLEFAIRRVRVSIHLARFNQWVVIVGALAALLLRTLGTPGPHLDLGPQASLALKLGAAFMLVGWLVAASWYERRKRRELQRLETLRDELEAEL